MADNQRAYAASATLTVARLKREDVVATTAGIQLTLPSACRTLMQRKKPARFTNLTAGYMTVFSTDGFLDGGDSVVVDPYDTIEITCVQSGTSYYYAVNGGLRSKSMSWSPTLSWTTATPTVTTTAEYKIVDGTCFFLLDIYSADGAGATALTATLPVAPKDIDAHWPCHAVQIVGTTGSDPLAYVEATSAAASRLLAFRGLSTCTDDSALRIIVAGFYEVDGFTSWTSTEAWTTATPTTTDVTRYKRLGNAILFLNYHSSADGAGGTQATFTTPLHGQTPDRDIYVACPSYSLVDGTYAANYAYVDCANATAESRVTTFRSFQAWTDDKACAVAVAGVIEMAEWSAFTPTFTFATADPDSYSTNLKSRYTVHEGICFFNIYTTSTDGNAASDLAITDLPVPARCGARVALTGQQLVNATWASCAPYITAQEATEAARKTIDFAKFTTCTNAQTCTFEISGFYFVG